MATRGKTIKTTTPQGQKLLRPMVTRRYELTVDHAQCCGCGTCETVCPREAISLSEPVLKEGRLVTKAQVDIDETKCCFCGECVAMCPTHALGMMINGEAEVPVLKGKAFPMLIRRVRVNDVPLEASTDVGYIENCPSGALSAEIERDAAGCVTSVRGVALDRQVCYNCTRCMHEAPQGGIEITKPFKGRILLDTSLCPEGCQACADVCPTHAMTYDGAKVSVDRNYCLFCGACERVCPVPGAVRSIRSGFLHTPIESAAWATAVEKLVSYQETAREYSVKSQSKRRDMVVRALLGGDLDNA